MAATTKSEPATQLWTVQKSLARDKAKSAPLEKKLTEALDREAVLRDGVSNHGR